MRDPPASFLYFSVLFKSSLGIKEHDLQKQIKLKQPTNIF